LSEKPAGNGKIEIIYDMSYCVFDRRKAEEDKFRDHYKKEISDIMGHMNNVIFLQKFFMASEPNVTPLFFHELSIVNKSIDLLATALVLLSHGSILESLAILRMTIEASSSALLLHFDENARATFVSNDINAFQSPKAITFAKTKVKYVGKLYGMLSNVSIHIDGTHLNIEPFHFEETIEDKKAFLLLIYLVTFIVERINEIVTIETIDNTIRTRNDEYRYISCSSNSIDKVYNEFMQLIFSRFI
jgi:hypothetical protein